MICGPKSIELSVKIFPRLFHGRGVKIFEIVCSFSFVVACYDCWVGRMTVNPHLGHGGGKQEYNHLIFTSLCFPGGRDEHSLSLLRSLNFKRLEVFRGRK